MPPFRVINESTEDTFGSTDNLEDAIRIAREVAQQGPAGDLVFIEQQGMCIRQVVLMPNGKVAEETIA